MKQYFEFNDATSHKFWEITLTECGIVTRYGKIGSDGQKTLKNFADKATAQKEYDTIVKEKTRKGYIEVKDGTGKAEKDLDSKNFSAKEWAKDYMQRFEKMVLELENHELVQNVRFNKGKPLTDEQLNAVHDKLGYKLNDYIVEFYKQNNGLQLHWNSFAAIPEVDPTKHRQEINSIKDFRRGDDDADAAEGWVCIYPFDTFIKNYGSELFHDKEEVNYMNFYEDSGDADIKVFDDYNFYRQTGFPINGAPNPCLYHYSNYGALCDDNKNSNFIIYMEFLLLTYGFVRARTGGLHGTSTWIYSEGLKVDPDKLPEFLTKCLKVEDSTIQNIIKDQYHSKGWDNIDSLGGLLGLTKDMDSGLQKKLFKVLELSSDDIEELKELYDGFLEENE
jgi:predicted DNA-binding WGR domain protein